MIKDELEYLEFSNNKSHLKLTLQGAHIFDFQVKGKERLLFLSETAQFKKGVPIRGGIPICWPWFGPHSSDKSLPNHGFARILEWKHLETQQISKDKTKITLGLDSSTETLKFFSFTFELRLEIVMSDTLEVSLITKNTDTKPFELSQALHTYLKINDISKTTLAGLEGSKYYSKVNNTYNNLQNEPLTFTQEIDRVYENVKCTLELNCNEEILVIDTKGSHTIVVWNPGLELTKSISDLNSHTKMLCIESANTLGDTRLLQSNTSHTLTTIITKK